MLKLASFLQQAELISKVTKALVQIGSKLKPYLSEILNEKQSALTLCVPFSFLFVQICKMGCDSNPHAGSKGNCGAKVWDFLMVLFSEVISKAWRQQKPY